MGPDHGLVEIDQRAGHELCSVGGRRDGQPRTSRGRIGRPTECSSKGLGEVLLDLALQRLT